MDAVQYLAQIEKRWRNVARFRALIDPTLFLMACLATLVALERWSIIDQTLSIVATLVIIFLVLFLFLRSIRHHRLPPKKIELFVDESLDARGRIISIAELRTQNSATHPQELSDFIEKQLSQLAEPPHPSELVPWNFKRKEIIKVALAVLSLILTLAIIVGSPKPLNTPPPSNPPQLPFDEIAKKLEETAADPDLPKTVQEALTETAQLIRDSETTQGQLQESIARGEKAIESAQKPLADRRANREREKTGIPTPQSSPDPIVSPTPTESQKGADTSTQSDQNKEDQERSQENLGGAEGDPSEPQDSGEPRDGKEKGEEQDADGGDQGDDKTEKKSQEEGTGAGESPKDSQKSGQGNDPKSEQSGEHGEGKEKPSDTGEASDDADSEKDGEGSKQQQALNQASDALQKAKEMSEPGESQQQSPPNQEQQGETPSDQGEKSEQQGPSTDANQQQKDTAPPQPEKGADSPSDADSDKKGESEAKQKSGQDKGNEQSPQDDNQSEQSDEEQKQGDSSPAGSNSETVPEDKKGDTQDKPATKSSLPQNDQESREFKEGDGKEWKGPDTPASFKDAVIENKGEVYDERFTGAESGSIRADGKPSGLGAIVPRPLGRPDSILDSSKQRVPLEYKDVID